MSDPTLPVHEPPALPGDAPGRRLGALELVYLLLLPPVIYRAFNYSPIHQNGYFDPFFYTGYFNNLDELLWRFDLPYYAVRFGLIWPGRLFTWALGPEQGYLALRYVLALTAGVPIYCLARRKFSRPVAVLAYAALISSPWFARTILWDHPDATGVPFLIAAFCLLLIPRESSWIRDGLAGCCASMAVNSNFFTIAIVGLYGVVLIAASLVYRTNWKTLVRRAMHFTAGFALIAAAGYLYYWHFFGVPRDILKPTIEVSKALSAGAVGLGHIPGFIWVFDQLHVLVPVWLTFFCIVLIAAGRVRFEVAVIAAACACVTAFFYFYQFVLAGNRLQLFYYFSYSLPTTMLMLLPIWHTLWERAGGRTLAFLAATLGAMLLPFALATAGVSILQTHAADVTAASAAVALVGSLAAVRGPLRNRHWPAIIAASTLALTMSVAWTGIYQIARPLSIREDPELDVYQVALQLIAETPQMGPGQGRLSFWYNNRNNTLNSVQSTYLWAFCRLNEYSAADPGLPHLGEFQLLRLRNPETRYLTLLGESPDEVAQGLESLTRAGFVYQRLSNRSLQSGNYRIYRQLIELTGRPAGPYL